MGVIKKIFQPKSKYDKTIPYTYVATVDVLHGYNDQHEYNSYIADTICGLIEYLDENEIHPKDVKLCGIYRDEEIELDLQYCTDDDGNWLKRPDICHSLEKHYKDTMEKCYKGHTGEESCSFNDRQRKGEGPF